ncbi:ATP-binding protein [endosymbiont of Tevnia jerichonana]|uniref:histidine kinase n=1 Tax=endosymbiont of Tevnia jerichonana (vent Tica) TaxID=1049564 RepID=G2FER7_9GAMM|nr:ATP-binding protein [endosymbiont of Tevnia jerichonana]EGW54649.1 signal transduction histidine-protein kinase BarA [endosymbiont of Tevnia jerichonana (vent Tica)]
MSPAVFAKELFKHSEYQSAWVRLIIWVFSAGYIGLGATTGYYEVDLLQYGVLFGSFLFVFLLLLVSVYYHPVSRRRRYLALLTDISAASLAIFLTQEAISPFYLLYIWIFVSYGTRYGKALLKAASLLSTLAYVVVLIALGEWRQYTFEAFFFLLLLVLLPLYQYSLLRKLHQARQEAEQANRARGNFLAAMTHELRTPLIGVIGMARLMESTPLNSEQKEYLHSINASAQLLRALIGDILDFSKIDANKLELEAAPIDLRELVGDVLSTISVAAQEKQIELVCEVDPAIPRELQGDGLRLSQILFNLLGNAIKFTDRGEVILRLRRRLGDERVAQPHILIEVQDSGIGMDQQQLQQVFGMFWQADPSSSRRFGGTGLGTTIVRDLSRLMGGHIDVSSELGQGSCFSVRLPLLPPQSGRMGVASPLLAGRKLLLIEANTAARQAHLAAVQELGMQGRGWQAWLRSASLQSRIGTWSCWQIRWKASTCRAASRQSTDSAVIVCRSSTSAIVDACSSCRRASHRACSSRFSPAS